MFIGSKEVKIEEIFKSLNYKGNTYQVSNNGRVFINDKELHSRANADGYLVVSTIDYGRCYRSTGVHRLVGLTFIENDDPIHKTEINHKDFNRKNNCVENLEWVPHADNVRYSVCNKPDLTGANNPNYGNKKLSIFYAEHPEIALEKQGRPGMQNGRCRKISMYKDGVLIKSFDYIVVCCEYIKENFCPDTSLDSIRSQIDKSIRENKLYRGYKFMKE